MSLASVVQNAMALCSLPVPTQVFSSPDESVKQMTALLYMTGRDLVKRHDWSRLLNTQTLTCLATRAQTGYPVAMFDRMARGTDVWNETNNWAIHGPVSSQEWRDLVVRDAVTLPQYWRLIGGELNIYAPSVGDTISYEYVSKYWIYSNGVTGILPPEDLTEGSAATFTNDNDTFLLPEVLLELGLVWRWKQSKQLDYAEDMRTYEIALKDEIDSDKGGRRIISSDRARMERSPRTWHGTVTPVA
jgi:hypothetical protein